MTEGIGVCMQYVLEAVNNCLFTWGKSTLVEK